MEDTPQNVNMSDPDFPQGLKIHPLILSAGFDHAPEQQEAIAAYGIAGRVW